MRGAIRVALCALAIIAAPAAAQQAGTSIIFPAGYAPGMSVCVKQGDGTCTPVAAANPLPIDTVQRGAAVDRGGAFGTSAAVLMPANAARRGIVVQVQSATASCYLNGTATATADYHSLQVVAGGYYESPAHHVGTGAVSIICTGAATPVYAREF